jgi:hypothetical protein
MENENRGAGHPADRRGGLLGEAGRLGYVPAKRFPNRSRAAVAARPDNSHSWLGLLK